MAKEVLTKENVDVNVPLTNKEAAIRHTGNILVTQGYVEESYIEKMMERERLTSTYIGNHVAIPHGTEDAKSAVKETGISIVTTPEGVDFSGDTVKILIGIAGKGDEILELLSKVALVCSEKGNIERILQAKSKDEIMNMFAEVKP